MSILLRLGIPEEFIGLQWDSLIKLGLLSEKEIERYEEIYRVATNWGTEILKGKTDLNLYLFGSNGSGKTALGCVLLQGLLRKNLRSQRVTMIRVQQDFFSGWKIPDKVLQGGLLMIDEVGKEYRTKNEHSEYVLEYVIKYRSERMLPTILVSNADIKYLYERYGETVNSVLRGRYIPLPFPNIDLRQRMGERRVGEFLKK